MDLLSLSTCLPLFVLVLSFRSPDPMHRSEPLVPMDRVFQFVGLHIECVMETGIRISVLESLLSRRQEGIFEAEGEK